MTPEERERIRAAARARAAEAPPLAPAQRDHLNGLFRDAMRVVIRQHSDEESTDA
jgi:hypothetical protein